MPEFELERRAFTVESLRASADEETKIPKIEGYAAVFNKLSEDLGGFREKIEFGAFSETVDDDVRALFNHDVNYVLGRTTNDTLQLQENRLGLKVKITPPGTQWANDLIVSIQRGDINQMSFGFTVIDDSWETKNEENIRTVKKVRLYDVSPVTFAAYPQTKVKIAARSIDMDAAQRLGLRIDHGLPLTDADYELLESFEKLAGLKGIAIDKRDLNDSDRLNLYTRIISGSSAQGSMTRKQDDGLEPSSSLSLRKRELELARTQGVEI